MDITVREPRVFDRMSALGDLARARILVLLERGDFTVSEFVQVFQLPQSTVSRHLKVLADDGWVTSRASGRSRYYRMARQLDPAAQGLWKLVRPDVVSAGHHEEDEERALAVRVRRRERSKKFFASAAHRWDALREDLYGTDSELLPLLGLLDLHATVGDLGAGTGHFSARVAPFVEHVIAVDGSQEMLDAARRRLGGRSNVELRRGELEALPVLDAELDLAVLTLVLHYVIDPPTVLREACRALSPRGRLLIMDMRLHSREGLLEDMGHVWPGFERATLAEWTGDAGFRDFTYQALPARGEALGPPLFVASAVRSD